MSEEVGIEQYVDHLFNHPVEKTAWHWDLDAPYLDIDPSQTARLIAEIFENSNTYLDNFSDAQINQGLWYLLSSACSNYMIEAISDKSVDDLLKIRVLRSFVSLFKTTMAARCTPYLSHIDESGAGPLNPVCYMWWDIMPYPVSQDMAEQCALDLEALSVMQQILDIPHDACRESALHGLGHTQASYPDEVSSIIDQWLQSSHLVRDTLRGYAKHARDGMVL